jgi:hypothetical protein
LLATGRHWKARVESHDSTDSWRLWSGITVPHDHVVDAMNVNASAMQKAPQRNDAEIDCG